MKISDEVKQKIEAEYKKWESQLWAGKSLKERQKFGQFATPPALVFKMLEKFDSVEDKDILDPCLGAGNLIAGAIIAGADPLRCYGIEIDPVVLVVAQHRLMQLGVPPHHLVQGNALDPAIYEKFEQDYDSLKTFAVVDKVDDKNIKITVCRHSKKPKEVVATRKQANNVLKKMKDAKVRFFKI